jgi:hypothetical protein
MNLNLIVVRSVRQNEAKTQLDGSISKFIFIIYNKF